VVVEASRAVVGGMVAVGRGSGNGRLEVGKIVGKIVVTTVGWGSALLVVGATSAIVLVVVVLVVVDTSSVVDTSTMVVPT
jgi:hypothetical protein